MHNITRDMNIRVQHVMKQNLCSFDKVKSEIRNCWTKIRIEPCKDGWQFCIKMPPPTLTNRKCNKDGAPAEIGPFSPQQVYHLQTTGGRKVLKH